MLKISYLNTFYFLRYAHVRFVRYVKSLFTNIQKDRFKNQPILTPRGNNSRILRIRNARFSGYCFHIITNIQVDSQICISVSLISELNLSQVIHKDTRTKYIEVSLVPLLLISNIQALIQTFFASGNRTLLSVVKIMQSFILMQNTLEKGLNRRW